MLIRPKLSIRSPGALQAAVEGLALLAQADLVNERRRGRAVPPLYRSGVRYERERVGAEDWQVPTQVLEHRAGDCEDLVAWRVAELRLAGERGAKPYVYRSGNRLHHVVVRRGNGTIEDPSALLGMRTR